MGIGLLPMQILQPCRCKIFYNFIANGIHVVQKGGLVISRTSISAICKEQGTFPR